MWDGIIIDDDVFVGPNVTFTNDRLPRSKQYPKEFQKTHLGEGSSIGANAVILGGISVGKHALIGAGSVVTKNVPNFALVYGNPAVIRGYVCKCGQKLDNDLECKVCNLHYVSATDGLEIQK